jgi:hypothetical protein
MAVHDAEHPVALDLIGGVRVANQRVHTGPIALYRIESLYIFACPFFRVGTVARAAQVLFEAFVGSGIGPTARFRHRAGCLIDSFGCVLNGAQSMETNQVPDFRRPAVYELRAQFKPGNAAMDREG